MATGRWRAMLDQLGRCYWARTYTASEAALPTGFKNHGPWSAALKARLRASLMPAVFVLFSLLMRSSDANSPMRHAHWNAYQPLVLRLGQAVAATGNFLELFPVDDAYVTPR